MAHSYMYQACKAGLFPTSPQELLSLTCQSLSATPEMQLELWSLFLSCCFA